VSPDAVRILWWDTKVHGEQLFTDNYDQIGSMLKPLGGGGTKVSCVSDYINKKKINAECVLVFTDGYLEHDVKWDVTSPTLWLVTENKSWTPPSGKIVHVKD
jgi:predicted metal-dependent peptidase